NLYDPGHLETLVGGLETSGADYVYTGVRHATYEPSGRLVEKRDVSLPWSFERVILGNFVYATGSAYRRSLWEAVSGYDERFEVFEDWDFITARARARARAPLRGARAPPRAGRTRRSGHHVARSLPSGRGVPRELTREAREAREARRPPCARTRRCAGSRSTF
ncbi:MAG TPA: hypothetical protein VHP60_00810, partial [Thermoanaerobaculia bacterium]|nr:hypothetical protein [Thermoanaerobaculia bacterium]